MGGCQGDTFLGSWICHPVDLAAWEGCLILPYGWASPVHTTSKCAHRPQKIADLWPNVAYPKSQQKNTTISAGCLPANIPPHNAANCHLNYNNHESINYFLSSKILKRQHFHFASEAVDWMSNQLLILQFVNPSGSPNKRGIILNCTHSNSVIICHNYLLSMICSSTIILVFREVVQRRPRQLDKTPTHFIFLLANGKLLWDSHFVLISREHLERKEKKKPTCCLIFAFNSLIASCLFDFVGSSWTFLPAIYWSGQGIVIKSSFSLLKMVPPALSWTI